MPEYTLLALLAVGIVLVLEGTVWRTGVLRTAPFWITMAICFAFMIPVNGWLTKLSSPIVLYATDPRLGPRFPFDIPIEDFIFGFALLSLTLLLWERAGRRRPDEVSR